MEVQLTQYKSEVEKELKEILFYWQHYVLDTPNGGYYGAVSNNNIPDATADKGSVLNARILWTFSRAYHHTKDERYLSFASRAYRFIIHYFFDKEFGGIYWTVDAKGRPVDTKKQTYAQAFCIYGLSEYYKAIKDDEVLWHAIQLFNLTEQHSFDKNSGGYLEAFSNDWKRLADQRLSDKDQNDAKTMNTHLHVIEAYASLYRVWNNTSLKKQIQHLLDCFSEHIIDAKTGHLVLFFDDQWHRRSSILSFGHDIEAAWLLQECAEAIFDSKRIALMKKYALRITDAALQGIDKDNGLFYEQGEKLIKEKHWWPQAEAMVGLLNAYEVSGNKDYLWQSLHVWEFIKAKIKSPDGEWFWGIDENNNTMDAYYKAGLWKCPYHNARACMEVAERIEKRLGGI